MKRVLNWLFSALVIANVVFTGSTSAQTTQHDKGDFQLVFSEPYEPDYQSTREFLIASGRFRLLIERLNQDIALSADITISFQEGDGPYYSLDKREIIINYDFITYVTGVLLETQYVESDNDLFKAVLDVVEFVLYHEIGHVLIHLLDLQINEDEEDAVDALSTVLLTEVVKGESDIPFTAADMFILEADTPSEFEAAHFWSEHSFDIQRFHRILCWVYANQPGKYGQLIRKAGIDEQQAAQWSEEYQEIVSHWLASLSPFLKK